MLRARYALLVLGGMLAATCKQATQGLATTGTTGTGGANASTTAAASGGSGGGFLVIDAGGDENPCLPGDPPAGPDPPGAACDPAADASACDLPPSVCAGPKWIIYYTNPQCLGGACHWDKGAFACPLCDCKNGACEMNFTK